MALDYTDSKSPNHESGAPINILANYYAEIIIFNITLLMRFFKLLNNVKEIHQEENLQKQFQEDKPKVDLLLRNDKGPNIKSSNRSL